MRMLGKDGAVVFNAAIAAFAAGAVAFAIFAMPNDLFSSLVGATGLSSMFSAAQPPLGMTARIAAMAGSAVAVFLLVWFLFGALDGNDEEADEDDDLDWEMPRLRRADAHPDAPRRRPLFAGRDLGEPEAPVRSGRIEELPLLRSTDDGEIPAFLAASHEPNEVEDDVLDLGGWVAEESETADNVDIVETSSDGSETLAHVDPWAEFDKVAHATAQDITPPAVEPVAADRIVPQGSPPEAGAITEPFADRPWVDAEPAEAPLPAEPLELGEDALLGNAALMARLPFPEDRGESISSLFERLDAGLAGCEWPIAAANEEQDVVGVQLRDALADLQKMAGRRA